MSAAGALPEPENASDPKLLAAIARSGWAVVGIPEDNEGPGYAFTARHPAPWSRRSP